MTKINLLDCTLRDGGYINDWRFGKEAIADMIGKLSDTNVEVLEVGFLKDEPYQSDRTVFRSMEQVKKVITPKKPGLEYAVMCEVVNPLPLELLEPRDDESADIIRVIVWKTKHDENGNVVDALDEGFAYCKGIVEKGYKLCVQPARVDQYSDEEFVAMVHRFAALNPMAIYVVDSWGTQNPEQLLHYMHLADENMDQGIILGYHGHNNMMQALSAAQAMIQENFNRDIMIDASVYGIGRGAGNLNLEIIAKYLNERCGKQYEIGPMLDVYDEYVAEIFRQEAWGYSIPYYLTAKYNCNPAYARFLKDLQPKQIHEFLAGLTEENRIIFKNSTAKQLLAEFRKKKTKLAVIIPTANRYQAIDNWLYHAAGKLREHCIDIIIFDSSSDNRTKNIVMNFQIDGYDNVIYQRYDGIYDGFSLDHKVMEAFRRYAAQYEYLWACRDSLIVDGDVTEGEIFPVMENAPDFIVVNPPWRCEKEYGSKEYRDCTDLFREQCMQMTVLGATIVKSSTIIAILDSIPLEKGRNYSLWQPIAYFEYIANHDFCAVYVEENAWNYNSAVGTISHWKSKSMQQWCWEWYHIVTSLPECYDPYKKEVLKIHMSDFHPFFARELVKIRAGGGLTWKELRKNRDLLPCVCDTKLGVFYAVAMLPVPVARYLAQHPEGKAGKLLRGIYCVIRGIAPGEGGIEE